MLRFFCAWGEKKLGCQNMQSVGCGFVFVIYSLVILYSDDYMFGDLNVIRFILLVLIFVVSVIFLIISPNVVSILLG